MTSEPRRSLVFPAPGLDGFLAALPALAALAATGRELRLVTRDDAAAALAPLVSAPAIRGEELAAWSAEEAWLLAREGAMTAWRAGVPRRLGWRGPLASLLLTDAAASPAAASPWERPAALLAKAGVALADPIPRLPIDAALAAEGEARLDRAGLGCAGGPRIGLLVEPPEAAAGWPRRLDEELARRLRHDAPGRRIALIATAATLWRAVRIYEETGKIHPVLGPDLPPPRLAAVLARLDLVIGPDSPLLRLAAAAGTRTVGVFASRRLPWAPPGEGSIALEARSGELPLDAVAVAVVDRP